MAVSLRYFTEFSKYTFQTHNRRVDLWRNLCTSLLYFVVHVRCRRKQSSRSLSHLLMSFLLPYWTICPLTMAIKTTSNDHSAVQILSQPRFIIAKCYHATLQTDANKGRLTFIPAAVGLPTWCILIILAPGRTRPKVQKVPEETRWASNFY